MITLNLFSAIRFLLLLLLIFSGQVALALESKAGPDEAVRHVLFHQEIKQLRAVKIVRLRCIGDRLQRKIRPLGVKVVSKW